MNYSVLVVDDSEIVLSATRAMLEEGGYKVSTHRRATGSVALILQTKPDLVLLDVNMPSLRGDMVARMSQATNQASDTVVVLHSTLSEQELQRLTQESGAHGYIRKTGDTQAFLRRVRMFLGETRPTSQARIRAPSPSEGYPSIRKPERTESVLLVDQDMMALSRLRTQMQGLGFTPSYALSFAQAKNKITSDEPEFIIINTQMDGVESFLESLGDAIVSRCVLLRKSGVPRAKSFPGPQLIQPVASEDLKAAMGQVLERRVSTGS